MSVELWVDRFIPKTLDDYVWRDASMRQKFEEYIAAGGMPHLLLSGKSGLGKTSLVRMMLRLLGVPEGDILFIKASGVRTIEKFEQQIMGFVQTYPMLDNPHGIKYVVLDEADSLSMLSYKFLRSEIESFSASTRFILTCNYPSKIEPAIISRCQQYHFEGLSMEEFVVRIAGILTEMEVEFDNQTLIPYIDTAYPDLRKCIGSLQKGTIGGKLTPMDSGSGKSYDWMVDAISYFQSGKIHEARTMIVQQAAVDEYAEIFRWLYQNIHIWGDTQDKQDEALVAIRDGLYKHEFVGDAEINLSATIAQLSIIKRG